MNDFTSLHRRTFLARSGLSLGGAALGGLLARDGLAATAAAATAGRYPGAVHPLHHPPRAKSVIFLCLAGGPSHLETFDPKPKLAALDGTEMPPSIMAGQPIAQLQRQSKILCLGPRTTFSRRGDSGTAISDLLPQFGGLADRFCVVRSMVTEQINHIASVARDEGDYAGEQFIQWFVKEQVEEVSSMGDLLTVVERSMDAPLEIEEYLARQPAGEGADPTAPSQAGGPVA